MTPCYLNGIPSSAREPADSLSGMIRLHAQLVNQFSGFAGPLQTVEIRTLLAAAAYAFSVQPNTYRQIDLTGKVLRRAKEIQQPGTRFRGGGGTRDDVALATADAARGLYELLTAQN
jgi:hypothetical protein